MGKWGREKRKNNSKLMKQWASNQETQSRWPTHAHIYSQKERRIDKTKGKGKGRIGTKRDEQSQQAQQYREKSLETTFRSGPNSIIHSNPSTPANI